MNLNLKRNFQTFNKEFEEYCESKKTTAKLIAVSKTKPLSQIIELYHLGQRSFAENYAQELRDKNIDNLSDINAELAWHFIGQIQKNKIKHIVGTATLIHTVDSYEKAALINSLCEQRKIKQNILLQINISNDKKKAGIKAEETKTLIRKIANLTEIQIRGLMTITEFFEDPEESRDFYKNLKSLSLEVESELLSRPELSMGMSNDYKVAIDEGATIVRVGSKIFGERKKIL
ncbi:MAG TPA: YggS family pyridoxal phosphate-dependent enzyme [Candidatus Dadabacteria bacterium]|mgnify:CR=1 FL=1|jgi:pyridoxal phosphate enzyme (YggS family)|nr:YggS family pyridoxal phosphate-dependent enzyme [Candidatus Dadabacteria bacterium]